MSRTAIALAAVVLFAAPARAQWAAETRLSSGGGDVWAHGIAATGTTLHVIWGIDPVRYRRSNDEGTTWSADTTLAASGEPHLTDPIIADGRFVYVIYLKNIRSVMDWCCPRAIGDIYLKRSVDGGDSWEPEQRLTTADAAFRISLAASGSRLEMVWMDFRGSVAEIYYRRSLDRGETWEPEVRLVSAAAGSVGLGRPQIASTGDNVHVVWGDDRDGNPGCYTVPVCPETYYKRSTDGGATWGADVRLTFGGTRFAGRPEVAVATPRSVIVNYNQDIVAGEGGEMFVMRSDDDGASWGTEVRLTFADDDSDHGAMIGAGSGVHLAWHDSRDPTNREIYYRPSSDSGASWGSEERVTNIAGDSGTPLPAVSDNYVHVLFGDTRSGSLQVWHTRRSLASTPVPDAGVDSGIDSGTCTPDCADRTCGPDGCGGTCGECSGDRTCAGAGECLCSGAATDCGGACVDVRSDEANCGMCGRGCDAGETCVAGSCTPPFTDAGACVADCSGRECGDDGCGGSCGDCPSGACVAGGICMGEASPRDAGVDRVPAAPTGVTGGCACEATGARGDLGLAIVLALALVTRRRARWRNRRTLGDGRPSRSPAHGSNSCALR